MTRDEQRPAGQSAGQNIATFLVAAAAGAVALCAVAAFLLWGFNGTGIVLDMVAFFCA